MISFERRRCCASSSSIAARDRGELGVDGIITDEADLLCRVLNEVHSRTGA